MPDSSRPPFTRPPTLRSLRGGLVDAASSRPAPSVLSDSAEEVADDGLDDHLRADHLRADGWSEAWNGSDPDSDSGAEPGAGPGSVSVPETGSESVEPLTGVVPSAAMFVAALNRTIEEAAAAQRTVFVFRIRGVAKGLLIWNDNPPIDVDLANAAVQEQLLVIEPNLALLALPDGELLGFDTELKADRQQADRLGARLLKALATPLGQPGREFVVSIRLGASIFESNNGGAEEAMQAASRALRQTSFATPFLIHNSYIADRSARLEQTGALLPAALEANHVVVEYQPRVDTTERLLTEIEVLPRWYHRDRGTIPPREFLRAAERTGNLVTLGRSTRHEAVSTAYRWQVSGKLRGYRLWMNLAPVELCHADFVEEVEFLTASHPYLELGFEVPDSGLLEDQMFLRIFDRMQEMGVRIGLDNVNHSSLSFRRLRRLPVSAINLDGELVRSLPSSAANRDLVRLMCATASEQNQTVTACGIETSEQLEVAAVLGVDHLQGFGISKVRSQASMEEYFDGGFPPSGAVS